jgi:hypothetical protein
LATRRNTITIAARFFQGLQLICKPCDEVSTAILQEGLEFMLDEVAVLVGLQHDRYVLD